MDDRRAALALGIGNVLWADEGFGVRAVEALHEAFVFPSEVTLLDGGTLGLALLDAVASSHRVLLFDAIDFRLSPGMLRVLRDAEVPAWGRSKLSPHQTGFNDVLALAALQGRSPEHITVIGVQPVELADFGGSLSEPVRDQLAAACILGADELARWGYPGRRRRPDEPVERLNAGSLSLADYEAGRPPADTACRVGDARLLAAAPWQES